MDDPLTSIHIPWTAVYAEQLSSCSTEELRFSVVSRPDVLFRVDPDPRFGSQLKLIIPICSIKKNPSWGQQFFFHNNSSYLLYLLAHEPDVYINNVRDLWRQSLVHPGWNLKETHTLYQVRPKKIGSIRSL